MKQRIKAIFFAVKHGILPYWMYERKRHHEMNYIDHLKMNLKYAWKWMTFRESKDDVGFEERENGNYNK